MKQTHRIKKTIETPKGKKLSFFIRNDYGEIKAYDTIKEAQSWIEFEKIGIGWKENTVYKIYNIKDGV